MNDKLYIECILEDFSCRHPDGLSDEERTFVKQHVLDLLGCGLAGREMWNDCPKPDNRLSLFGDGGERLKLWGEEEQTGALEAAVFINGCQSAYHEMDDATSAGASVHPGTSVIPAALAAAEYGHRSGRQFMEAVLAGYEVCNRYGLMATRQVQNLGLYGPAFAGIGGSVAAAGALMGLNRKQLIWSFSNALSLAPVCPFIQFTDGCMIKHYYNGWSLYTALACIRMAERGVSGSSGIAESPRALEALYEKEGMRAFDRSYGMAVELKPYACCKSVQYTLTAAERIQMREGVEVGQVEKIRVLTYPYAAELSQGVTLLNRDSARLSIPYCTAVLLRDKALYPEAFADDKLTDPSILRLADKVTVGIGEAFTAQNGGKRGAIVEICLSDGRVLRERADVPKWGTKNRPGWEGIEQKFKNVTRKAISLDKAELIINAVKMLESYEDMADFCRLL